MADADARKEILKGTIYTILGGIFWGLSGSCGQYLFEQKDIISQWLVPIRLICAGVLLLVIVTAKSGKAIIKPWKNKRFAFELVVFGVFGMALCQLTYFSAIQASNAGTATVLQYLGPVLIMVYMCIRNKVPPKRNELIAICFALFGVFLLATHGNVKSLAISPIALGWGLCSAFFLLLYTVQPQHLLQYFETPLIIGWGMLIGGILLMAVFRPWEIAVNVDGAILLAMAVIIIFGTLLSFNLYLEGVKRIGPTKGSLMACVEPVAATIISAVWLKVAFTGWDIAGFVFIIATIFILNEKRKKSGLKKKAVGY